jgi:pimeloyl-ACP methyl ester carboxylesterase
MSSSLRTDAGTDPSTRGIEPARSVNGFVEAGGLLLNFLDYGTVGRPPMLCVHGGAIHAHWFDFVAPGFVTDYHVRALDQRGHGDSAWAEPPDYSYARYAADLAEVVEKFDLRDFVLIGHSMGGMTSLIYAATHPGRVAKLVMVDSTMHMTEERIAPMREVGNREGKSYATQDEIVARYRLRPPGSTAPPAVIRHVAQHAVKQYDDDGWRHKFDRRIYALRESVNGFPHWNDIKIPALVVKGELSPRISPEVCAEIKTRCPQAEFAEVSNADHHVVLDNPTGFVEAVQAFLARHP